jgi:riboflavin biosynthesis pyrimidine reductase
VRLLFPPRPGFPGEKLDDEALTRLYQPPDRVPADRPWLRVNFVASVDGAVEVDGYSKGLGSPADKRVFGLLRGYPDALLVGAGTLRHEGYGPVRLDEARRDRRVTNGQSGYPGLVVVSGRLDLAPTHPALAAAPVRPTILTCEQAPADRRTALAGVADVIAVGAADVDLAAGLAALRRRGVRQVLCEGGPHLFGALTTADLVDEVCLTVTPMLTGPGAGRITAGPPSPVRDLALAHVLEDSGVLLLRYTRSG